MGATTTYSVRAPAGIPLITATPTFYISDLGASVDPTLRARSTRSTRTHTAASQIRWRWLKAPTPSTPVPAIGLSIMNAKYLWAVLILLLGAAASSPSRAQITFSEDFTGATTANSWYFFSGACLTAGTSTCDCESRRHTGLHARVLGTYYSQNHAQANTTILPGRRSTTVTSDRRGTVDTGSDPGCRRQRRAAFHQRLPLRTKESGAILSANTFSTGAGIQVTFKTVTYHGDSGGTGRRSARTASVSS